MAIIQEKDRAEIQKRLKDLPNPVKIINFTQELECDYCRETRQIMEEIAELSDNITLEVYNFVNDKELVEKFNIDKIPATVIMGDKDYGIRFYGIPSGYEFSTLLEDIIMVGNRDSGLSSKTREKIASISTPLHFQVFVTPTCPYCPRAVFLAHQLAMENDNIVSDMVEAIEFPHLSQKYHVMGVPKTVVNDQDLAEGAMPEDMLVERLMPLLQKN